MNKTFKIIAGVLLAVVVVVAAGIAYIAATFDPNQYKPQIIQAVKDKTGRTLKLDGDIKLSFFPSIGASLGKAALSDRDSEREFAGFDDLHIAVALLPLFSKDVVVEGVEVTNLRATLVRFKNGKTSIDDLTAGSTEPPVAPAPAGPPVKIDIAYIKLKNAAITYDDQAGDAKYELSKLDLKTGRIVPGVPSKVELSFNVQSSKPELNLDTVLATSLTFDLDKQIYGLQGLDFRATGLAAGIRDLVAVANGSVEAKLASKEYLISGLAVTATGKQTGGDLDVKLDVPKLTIAQEQVSGNGIALDAKLNADKTRLAVKLDIPGIAGNKQSFKADALTLKAQLTSALAGNFDAQRIDLDKFKAAANVNDPQLPKNPIDATITGSATVDLDDENASVTFATKFDDSNINGRAGLTKFSPPFYTFEVNIDQLDLDRYLPKSVPTQQAAGAASPAAAAPESPLDLSALKGLNASGSVKIGSLKVSNVKAANVRVGIKAGGDKLDVNPIAANLYQGSLSGALSVNVAATPVIAMKQALTGVNVGPLLKDAANFESLEGKGNVTLDVAGQGNTVSAIKKALNGSAAIRLNDGAIKGINIAATIRNVKSKIKELKGEQVQAASATEKTDFSELSASFNIKNGVAHNSDLAGKSPLLRLGGEGDIDIGNENLDYLVKATVVATSTGQGGKELADVNGVTVPVRLTGPFSAPQYKIDFAAILQGALKAKVEEKKEEIKAKVEQKVEDKLKDKLKGLFGK